MKKMTFFQLIFTLLALTLWGCKTNEKITPLPDTITDDYLGIKDFKVNNAIVKNLSPDKSAITDYLVVVLPETYLEDFITPTITLNVEVQSISPKSDEKIYFEGKEAVEYTVTKKDGQLVKFKLYVYRKGKIGAELFTKEIKLNSRDDNYIRFRLKNIGTLGNPSGSYGQGNIPIIKVFNSNNKEIFSSWVLVNGNDTTTTFISSSNYEFLKKGDFKVSFSMNDDTLFGKTRKSDVFSFKIVNGEKAFISPSSSFERAWLLNTDNLIKGVNFDARKKYEIIFENEYLSSPIILTPKVVDENNLSVKIPSNIDTLQCFITLKENENVMAEADGAIILNRQDFIKNCEFSTNYERGYQSFIKKNQPFIFDKRQDFGAYYVVSYGYNAKEAYSKGGLKLINLASKKEYNLNGNFVGCIWDCSASYWSFTIDESIPKGLYEVYGINPQVNAGRYWRKLEVK